MSDLAVPLRPGRARPLPVVRLDLLADMAPTEVMVESLPRRSSDEAVPTAKGATR